MNPDQESGHARSHAGSSVAIWVSLSLVMYVFLLGPAAFVYDSCPQSVQDAIAFIYTPLEWLDNIIPGRPFTKYVEIWES